MCERIILLNMFFVVTAVFGGDCTTMPVEKRVVVRRSNGIGESKEDKARCQLIDSLYLMPTVLVRLVNQYCSYRGSFIPFFDPASRDYTRIGAIGDMEARPIIVCGMDENVLSMRACTFTKQLVPDFPPVLNLPNSWDGQSMEDDLRREFPGVKANLKLSSCGSGNATCDDFCCSKHGDYMPGMNETMRAVIAALMSCNMSVEPVSSPTVKIGRKNSMLYKVAGMRDDHLMQGIKMWFERLKTRGGSCNQDQRLDYAGYVDIILAKYPKHEKNIQKIIDGQGKYAPVFWARGRSLQECVDLVLQGEDDFSLQCKSRPQQRKRCREILRQARPPVRRRKLLV